MGIKFRDAERLNQKFKDLQKKLEHIEESTENTTQKFQEVSADLVDASKLSRVKVSSNNVDAMIKDWAHVEDLSESDRYPLVKTSESGFEEETQVILKKLDII
jgi:hypothetical protein